MESISNTNKISSAQTAHSMDMTNMSAMGAMSGEMMGNMCPMHQQCMMEGINHLSIGMKAPDFTARTTFGMMKMSDYKSKWLVFFSHPGDFAPVAFG